jgi:hypothetical protein
MYKLELLLAQKTSIKGGTRREQWNKNSLFHQTTIEEIACNLVLQQQHSLICLSPKRPNYLPRKKKAKVQNVVHYTTNLM